MILFTLGISIGFLRNNSKKSIQDDNLAEKSLTISVENQKITEKDMLPEIKKNSLKNLDSISKKSNSINNFNFKELTEASPSLEEIRNLINAWLQGKSSYLAGNSEINLSKIVNNALIERTIEERKSDIKKGIYKKIDSQILKVSLLSQNSSRISVLVEMDYEEKIIKSPGELLNQTSLTPLKVKYILGFSNKSWKLVDFVSGL